MRLQEIGKMAARTMLLQWQEDSVALVAVAEVAGLSQHRWCEYHHVGSCADGDAKEIVLCVACNAC